jgi:hypothetical protein
MEITAEARAEAKKQPGSYLYVVEGVDDPMGHVPPENIKGAWKVDDDGEIVGDFILNPKFTG